MREESNFKVTDRRLFNSDGTPRDYEREESPEATPAPVKEKPVVTESQSSDSTESEELRTDANASAVESHETRTATDEEPVDLNDHAAIPGADDPASFINFLMSIASNAASALGMMEHPVTGERGVDLELGKHWIDILGMLKEKTKGNLHPQEEKIFIGLLSDLRMQFVSLSKASPKAAAGSGLTGKDIIGGK